MSDLHDLLRARLAIVRGDLERALDQAEGFSPDWAPAPGVRTLGGLLAEIAATEVQLLQLMEGGPITPYPELERVMHRPSFAEFRQLLSEVREATLARLAAWSEADLLAEVDVDPGGWEGLGLARIPRAELVRSLAAHEWYHTGQLITSLWVAGRDPYEG